MLLVVFTRTPQNPNSSPQSSYFTLTQEQSRFAASFMAETKDQEETTLLAKRKPNPSCEDQADYPKKTQKVEVSGNNSEGKTQEPENLKSNSSVTEEKNDELEGNAYPDGEDEDEDEEEEYEEEEDGEKPNGESEVDRKGKGIMRDDKGKGILIEEDEDDEDDDSDDDSSDGGSEFEDGDSDLSDDPLAEVDLDNILPSRTRRRQVQPGVYIRNDNGNNNNEDDDSDDSDGLS